MHPSALLSVLAIGLYSFTFIQGAVNNKNRRINRLKSVLPGQEDVGEQKIEVDPATAAEKDGSEFIIDSSSEATNIDTQVKEQEKEEESVQVISQTVPVLSLEDRRAVVFDILYIEYEAVVGRYCRPGIIEWHRVTAQNWPEYIDMSDMSKWSEEDVELLSFLVDTRSIVFKFISKGKKNPPKPLISTRIQNFKIVEEKVQAKLTNDSELGLPSVEESEKKPAAIAFVEAVVVKAVEKSPATLKSKSGTKKIKKGKMKNFKSVKVDSDMPADPEKRATTLSEALKIYRRDSGNLTDEEIDWSSFKVFYLQNHLVPFSTGLETEGDVRTLEALMNNKFFGFHNPQMSSSRRIIIFERLYKMYKSIPGLIDIDPFLVKWCQIKVQGWPEGVSRSYSLWKPREIEEIERLLDAGKIEFTLKNDEKKPSRVMKKAVMESYFEEESEYSSESSAEDYSVEESSDSSVEDDIATAVRSKRKREASKLVDNDVQNNENCGKIQRIPVKTNEIEPSDSVDLVVNLHAELVAVIENLTKAKDLNFPQSDRHKRIISEMIKCFNLLQKHTNNENIEIPANEVLDFIEIFHKALAAIGADGEMNKSALKSFVIGAIKLRARLAGIAYTQEKQKQVLRIPKDRIRDPETFGFLKQAECRWSSELALLEFALDAEDSVIFL
jgi:hypothetical protein